MHMRTVGLLGDVTGTPLFTALDGYGTAHRYLEELVISLALQQQSLFTLPDGGTYSYC